MLVATVDGVDYVDDSKATNPHAAGASLAAYPRVVWIAGGLLKGADVDPLVAAVAPRLAGVVLLGRDRAVIAASLARHAPMVPVVTVVSGDDDRVDTSAEETMTRVVAAAARLAGRGTPSSWRRRPPPWTCSATTRTAAGRSPTPSGRWDDGGHARSGRAPREAPAGRSPTSPRTAAEPVPGAPPGSTGPMTSCHLVLGAGGCCWSSAWSWSSPRPRSRPRSPTSRRGSPGVQQVIWAGLGLGAMLVALRLPAGFLRRWSPIALIGVAVLLVLVLIIGSALNGAKQWFDLGFAYLQPSELAKLVFALWGAHVIALRERYLTTSSLLVPVLPVFGVLSLLLIAEPDFGAVATLGLVLVGLLWAGGCRCAGSAWSRSAAPRSSLSW